MSLFRAVVRPLFLWLLAGLFFTGCVPGGNSPLDEQKDPYFLKGKSRANSLDYQGAIEAYERALEANPRSASAHKELGILYYERTKDYAAAIYHFDRLLRLRPDDPYAFLAKEYIVESKRQLASTVWQVPVTQQVQRQLEQLEELKKENAQLKLRVEALKAQVTHHTPVTPTLVGAAPPPPATTTNVVTSNQPPRVAEQALPGKPLAAAPPAAPPARTHSVKAGETPSSIARQYGIAVNVLLEANPRLNPRRMQIGQTLKIPAP